MQKENLFFFSFSSAKNFGEARVTKSREKNKTNRIYIFPCARIRLRFVPSPKFDGARRCYICSLKKKRDIFSRKRRLAEVTLSVYLASHQKNNRIFVVKKWQYEIGTPKT